MVALPNPLSVQFFDLKEGCYLTLLGVVANDHSLQNSRCRKEPTSWELVKGA